MENITIIGSGPAGLTAAIYLSRAELNPLVVAGDLPGGQLINTSMVENYPGFDSILGLDLMMKMMDQARKCGTRVLDESVQNISKGEDGFFETTLNSGKVLTSKSVLIATGAKHKHLGIPGEDELTNKGVSWCATCDGPLYKNKTVAVVGGGNTAVMEALFLSNFVEKVYLIHRRDMLRADKLMQEKLRMKRNVSFVWDSEIKHILGNTSVEKIVVKNRIDEREEEIMVDGVFIAIGTSPVSEFVAGFVDFDEEGYIIANNTKTSQPGVFAAGDVVSGSLKQAVYAAGQGALAAKRIEEYLGM